MSASNKKKLRKEQNAVKMTARQTQAQKEAKQLKRYTATFITILVVILVAAISLVTVRGVVQSGMLQKNSIAAVIGDHEINAIELNYYYFDAINENYQEWYNQYGSNTAVYLQLLMNLNVAAPLDEQVYDTKTGQTWASKFVELAIENAKRNYVLCDLAAEAGFELDADTKASIDSQISVLPLYASIYGYSSAEKYLAATYCYGANEDNYRRYLEMSALADTYLAHYAEELSYTDEQIREFEKEKLNNYNSYTYSTVYLSYTNFLPEQKKDENGKEIAYTEEEKNAARAKAQAVAESLLTAKDYDELKLAVENLEINKDKDGNKLTTLTVSATNNKNVIGSKLPSLLTDWLTSSDRVKGDSSVIVNEYTPNTEADKEDEKTEGATEGTTEGTTEGVTEGTTEAPTEGTTEAPTEGEDKKEEAEKVINGYYVVLFDNMNDNKVSTVDVRHLLVSFEGGTKSEDGKTTTYSEEEKAAAKKKAEELLAKWETMEGGKTEENFITLVKENTGDSGSKETGGLYENITYDQNYVEPFLNWCIDENRKPEDVDIIETEYGFHIMYFVETNEMNYRDLIITSEMRSEDTHKWYEEQLKGVSTETKDMKWIKLDTVISG